MTEKNKENIIKNHILKIETSNNPYYDISIRITEVDYHVRQSGKPSISIGYYLTKTSKLDSKWNLETHKTTKLLGTFESIFIAANRAEKLKQLGI
jgi:hypothetical protein